MTFHLPCKYFVYLSFNAFSNEVLFRMEHFQLTNEISRRSKRSSSQEEIVIIHTRGGQMLFWSTHSLVFRFRSSLWRPWRRAVGDERRLKRTVLRR
ncbi:hypothetical protein CDAR_508731 [Caerostris darwini]|uniref:Uncharacterized protein n=1 Tax=Caerostris darwini TaxID=1538125 RepID=A0AAV4N2T9_9ARAC|nr:hypothetical protein CDAR_508731 [Caerostris darwini]